MEKSNPRPNPRLSWTRGSYDPHESPPAPTTPPDRPVALLRVAQLILTALDPFPDAHQAVLIALRTLSIDWDGHPNPLQPNSA